MVKPPPKVFPLHSGEEMFDLLLVLKPKAWLAPPPLQHSVHKRWNFSLAFPSLHRWIFGVSLGYVAEDVTEDKIMKISLQKLHSTGENPWLTCPSLHLWIVGVSPRYVVAEDVVEGQIVKYHFKSCTAEVKTPHWHFHRIVVGCSNWCLKTFTAPCRNSRWFRPLINAGCKLP